MRTYIIKPYIKTYKNGSQEQIGFIAICQRWKSSNHCAVELCETAVRKREREHFPYKESVLDVDYQIIYKNCCASA